MIGSRSTAGSAGFPGAAGLPQGWRRSAGGSRAARFRKRAVLRIVDGLFGGLSTDAMPAAGPEAASPDILQIRSRVGRSARGPRQGWRYPWGIIVIPTLTNNNPLTPRKTKKGSYLSPIASLSPHRLSPHRKSIVKHLKFDKTITKVI